MIVISGRVAEQSARHPSLSLCLCVWAAFGFGSLAILELEFGLILWSIVTSLAKELYWKTSAYCYQNLLALVSTLTPLLSR